MLDPITPYLTVEYIAPTVVIVGVLLRLWLGDVIFHPRETPLWNTLRRVFVPLLGVASLLPRVPNLPDIENKAEPEEYVGVVRDRSPKQIAKQISKYYDIEIPLLAGFKTFLGRYRESSTWVRYHGPKPVSIAPDWLRPYQTHVTTFSRSDGAEIVTAHYQANSYRPDMWTDHLYKGETFSAAKGVENAHEMFAEAGIDVEQADLVGVEEPRGG